MILFLVIYIVFVKKKKENMEIHASSLVKSIPYIVVYFLSFSE